MQAQCACIFSMKKLIIICLIAISGNQVIAQVKFIISTADSAMLEYNYELAIHHFKKKLADINTLDSFTVHYNSYRMACAYRKIGQPDSMFKYLSQAVDYRKNPEILTDCDYYPFLNDPRWEKIYNVLSEHYFKTNPDFDQNLCRILWKMSMRDQLFYSEIKRIEKKEGIKSKAVDSLFSIKRAINEENQKTLDSILVKSGFPRLTKVGYQASHGAFLIVQHAALDYQTKLFDTLIDLAKVNEIDKQSFCMYLDRVYIDNNKPQLYGTQIGIDSLGYNFLFPVEDPENLDKRRQEMDLVPMEMYLQFFTFRPDSLPPFEFKWHSSSP